MKTLKLSKDLTFPVDVVTQTLLIVGKRGSGKSNTAARLVEQFHRCRLPFVVLDPVDTWWGLKASRDGSGPGLDVYVFGGSKADLPLEAGGGALIAEVLCEHRISMVLSVKHLSGRARSAFMVAFAQTLFQKWQGGPLHVVLEEAHELAPQMAGGRGAGEDNEAAMLGAFKRLWKLGRSSGIGGTAVTQRPASLSKDITTQSEILIAHRTIGPQDVKAIGEWVKYHGQHEQILGDLPTLPTGEAFVWAPEFPADPMPIGLLRTSILRRDTYDSASTPKVGEHRVEPKALATVDLERLRTKMAATIEKAKADDPRELRRQIAELKKQVEQRASAPAAKAIPMLGKPVLTDADRELLRTLSLALSQTTKHAQENAVAAESRLEQKVLTAVAEYLNTVRNVAVDVAADIESRLGRVGVQKVLAKLEGLAAAPVAATIHASPTASPATRRALETVARAAAGAPRPAPPRVTPGVPRPDSDLVEPEQRILDSLAWWQVAGVDRPSRHQVAFGARYTVNGHFNNTLGGLRTKGLIDYPDRGCIGLTDAGVKLAVAPASAGGVGELIEMVSSVLREEPQRRVFAAVVNAGQAVSREELAAAANYTVNGHFNNTLGSLSSLGVVTYPQRGMVALGEMFNIKAR